MTAFTQTMRIPGATIGLVLEVEIFISDCAACGLVFGITKDFEKRRRQDGENFYCPAGHVMIFGKSEADKERAKRRELEKRLADEEASRQRYQEWLRREREGHKATERSLAATKGVVTRQRNRAAAALCPVEGCGRSFTQLRRHLATKHPDYPTTSRATATGRHHNKEITQP